jgi:hypothetical protein
MRGWLVDKSLRSSSVNGWTLYLIGTLAPGRRPWNGGPEPPAGAEQWAR